MDTPNFNTGEQFAPMPIRAKIENPVSKEIKAKIDTEMKGRSQRRSESMLQRYDNLPKRNGMVNSRSFLI